MNDIEELEKEIEQFRNNIREVDGIKDSIKKELTLMEENIKLSKKNNSDIVEQLEKYELKMNDNLDASNKRYETLVNEIKRATGKNEDLILVSVNNITEKILKIDKDNKKEVQLTNKKFGKVMILNSIVLICVIYIIYLRY